MELPTVHWDKETWYDWGGANTYLFKHINGIEGDWYNAAMIFLSRTADYHNFPYFLGIFVVFGLSSYFLRKLCKRGGATPGLTAWLAVLCVYSLSFAVDGATIKLLKDHFSYPRPYVVLGPEKVTMLDYEKKMDDDHHSLPSGHASFITTVVASLWPVLSPAAGLAGLLLILGVCWSRIAEGMHFPADVLIGSLLALLIVLVVRSIIYKIFRKFHLKC